MSGVAARRRAARSSPVPRRCYDVAFYLPTLGPLLAPADRLPAGGGAETQIWLLARALARRGCAVCVVVMDTPSGVPATFEGVDVVVRAPWQGGNGWRGQRAELQALWGSLAPLEANVVVQRSAAISTGLVGAMSKAKRRKFIFSTANIVDFDFEKLAPTSTELRLYKLGIRLADVIVVQTHEQATRCQERFGRTALVIKSIAEPADVRNGSPEAFLWIGRLVGYKHPEAFLELAAALPEARFRLVGLPSRDNLGLAGAVERQARKLANLELVPPRSRPELLRLYDTAVAVVNTGDYEGMPNIFLEGWSRGIPALALTHDPDGVIESNCIGGFAHGSRTEFEALARRLWTSRTDQADVAVRCRDYVRREHGIDAAVAKWAAAL